MVYAARARLQALNAQWMPRKLLYDPHWLVLGVNNLCNLHCKTCDVGTKTTDTHFYQNLMGAHPRNMPKALLWKVIDQAASHFPNVRLGYAFTEPSIYPHLVESLAYARDKGLISTMTTNGLKLEAIASDLRNAGLAELYLSLDGPEAIHNHIRGHRSSFQKAMAGIEALGTDVRTSIFCTISEWNIGHLVNFLNDLRDVPIHTVGFMHPNYTTPEMAEAHNQLYGTQYPATPSNLTEMDPKLADLNTLLAEIKTIRSRDWPFQVHFSPEITTMTELERFYHHGNLPFGKSCGDVFRALMIKTDGSVIPAHGRCYQVEAGNLYDHDLPSIWNSAALAAFRKALQKVGGLMPACARCCSAFTGYVDEGA